MKKCMGIPATQLKSILGHHEHIEISEYRAEIGAYHAPTLVNGMTDGKLCS